jgi:hypothetical protein
MQVPASEVRGPYVNDDPYQEEDTGPEHTADLIFGGSSTNDWKRVVKVVRDVDRAVIITLESRELKLRKDSWAPIEILRPVHQPPFDAGLSGYHR